MSSSEEVDNTFSDTEDAEIAEADNMLITGQTSLDSKINSLKKDPQYKQILEALVQDKVKEGDQTRQRSHSRKSSNDVVSDSNNVMTPNANTNASLFHSQKQNAIKSPSDSTLYTPALRQNTEQNMMLNQISNFVENIRLEHSAHLPSSSWNVTLERPNREQPSVASEVHVVRPKEVVQPGTSSMEAKQATDKVFLDAKRFKASLVAPKGTHLPFLPEKIDKNLELLRKLDDDDDFFHVSCHIEDTLRQKIERGDYVELEKLLPKEKSIQGHTMEDVQRLELVVRNGHPYFGARQSEGKINNIRKWD